MFDGCHNVTVALDLVTLATMKTWPLKSPWSTSTSTPFFDGVPGLRSSKVMKSCCHLLLLSVQYIATLDGCWELSN